MTPAKNIRPGAYFYEYKRAILRVTSVRKDEFFIYITMEHPQTGEIFTTHYLPDTIVWAENERR